MFLISLNVIMMTLLASPLAEPEPEPEAEAEPSFGGFLSDSSSLVGFYNPVYYQYQQGQHPGYTYRFGPPLPPLQEQASDLGGDTFRNAFQKAFNQYITAGLLNNYRRGEHLTSHLGENNRDDLDLEDSQIELSEYDGGMEDPEAEEIKYPEYEDDRETSVSDKDQLPLIEIFK